MTFGSRCIFLHLLFLAAAIGDVSANEHPERPGPAAILILGQSLSPDGSAPDTLVKRVEKAAELYHTYAERPAAAVVPSGGDPARVGATEASVMRQLLLRRGVSDADIHLESQALTTVENVLYAIPILRKLRVDRVTVVTSDFHMPRASLIVEAILQNQTAPDEFALTLVDSPDGCPKKDAPPGVDINEESLVQRLRREVQNVHGRFHEGFFTSKALGLRIPTPSGDRLRHALYELSVQLDTATTAAAARARGLIPPGLRGGGATDDTDHSTHLLLKFGAVAFAAGLLGVLLGCAMRGPFQAKPHYMPVEIDRTTSPGATPIGTLQRQSS